MYKQSEFWLRTYNFFETDDVQSKLLAVRRQRLLSLKAHFREKIGLDF